MHVYFQNDVIMQTYLVKIISTAIIIVLTVVIRYIVIKIIRKYARLSAKIESRTNHIIRVCTILANSACLLMLVVLWGVDPRNLFVVASSVFAVIGVALFAQWSILSNITAGIIIFFTAPFRIGDYIRIMDKDVPLDAQIEGIFSFYTHLRTKDGCLHIYPNSLMLQKGISILKEPDPEDEQGSLC